MKLSPCLVVLSLLLAATTVAQQAVPSADAVLQEACATAAKEKKNVFIIFHASWCGWCHRMDTLMNNAGCKKYFDDHYVIRHLTVHESDKYKHLENPGAVEMKKKYNGDNQGIPYWLIFDAQGKLLADSQRAPGENTGCPATKEEVAYFLEVLRKTSPLKDDALAVIEKNFLKQ